jgi:hypothetical protein
MMFLLARTIVSLLMLFTFAGCSAQPVSGAPATQSQPGPATQLDDAITLNLDDAVAADDLQTGDWEIDLPSQIPFKDRPLYFGQLAIFNSDDKATASVPVIGFKKDQKLMALRIDDPRLVNANWSYIAAGPTNSEFWGVLDAATDDRQPQIVIAHSADSGQTLQLTSLPKPLPVAVFDSFCMDRQGHGRLSLYVYRDQAKLRRAGYYHYRTSDGGKTWSGPEHEVDGMLPADDAPADVVPDPKAPSRA